MKDEQRNPKWIKYFYLICLIKEWLSECAFSKWLVRGWISQRDAVLCCDWLFLCGWDCFISCISIKCQANLKWIMCISLTVLEWMMKARLDHSLALIDKVEETENSVFDLKWHTVEESGPDMFSFFIRVIRKTQQTADQSADESCVKSIFVEKRKKRCFHFF